MTEFSTWHDRLKQDMLLGQKRLAVLVDPESVPRGDGWLDLINAIQRSQATDVFVGGSLVGEGKTEPVVRALKDAVSHPVVLFPGAPNQVVQGADALLYLSLISGRNPDLLIGRHVESAPRIVKMGIPTVATGYMLLGDPPLTAAAYISHSLPIPMHKPELAVATAQAGCLLGMQCIFMDAGSGAGTPISTEVISAVREAVDVPIVVGGGMTSQTDLDRAWEAGATCCVVGTAIEKDPEVLDRLATDAFRIRPRG